MFTSLGRIEIACLFSPECVCEKTQVASPLKLFRNDAANHMKLIYHRLFRLVNVDGMDTGKT